MTKTFLLHGEVIGIGVSFVSFAGLVIHHMRFEFLG